MIDMGIRYLRSSKVVRFKKFDEGRFGTSDYFKLIELCTNEVLKEVEERDLYIIDNIIVQQGLEGDDFTVNKRTLKVTAKCVELPK